MFKIRSAAIAVAMTIIWLCGCAIHPVPTDNPGTNFQTAPKKEKTVGTATRAVREPASGGKMVRPDRRPGTYVVRTVWKNAPLSNVRVKWWRKADDAVPIYVGDTIRFGTAIFRPTSGLYYLTADWRQDGNFERPRKPGDRFVWYGGNPVYVSSEISEMISLVMEVVLPPPVLSAPQVGNGVFGRVMLSGVPAGNVGVYVYAKTDSGFKGDDFQAVVRTNAAGEFALELPPAQYYILARLRADNSVNIGPLHKGDLLGFDPMNPVVVEKGHYTASAIPLAQLKMVKSRTESSSFLPGIIEGRIVDINNRPVPGAYAALYSNQSMSGRSVFRSEPTGADGRFKLSVLIPGSYFLSARSGYGTPVAGGWFGAWSGNADHRVQVKSGDARSGVDIIVGRLTK